MVNEHNEKDIESFVCALYGKPGLSQVIDSRYMYAIFRTKYDPTDPASPLAKLKGADPSLLPPAKTELQQMILRMNLVASIWKHADTSVPLEMDPTENGWKLRDGKFVMNWFAGSQIPENICEGIANLVNLSSMT